MRSTLFLGGLEWARARFWVERRKEGESGGKDRPLRRAGKSGTTEGPYAS